MIEFRCPFCNELKKSHYWGTSLYCWKCRVFVPIKKCKEVKVVRVKEDEYFERTTAQFFKAQDLKGQETTVTIKNVREADLPNTGKTLIIDFDYNKEERSLPLNKTNFRKLVEKFGNDTNDWEKQRIKLFKVWVNNPRTKQEVESIRIR